MMTNLATFPLPAETPSPEYITPTMDDAIKTRFRKAEVLDQAAGIVPGADKTAIQYLFRWADAMLYLRQNFPSEAIERGSSSE
jgi:hypothetical protein